MDAQPPGTQVQAPGTLSSFYTTDQQKSLFDKAMKQADYEYAQAQCEGTARLNVIATRPPVSTPTPQAPAMREDDDYIA